MQVIVFKKMLKFSSDLCFYTPWFLFGTEQSLKFLTADSFFFFPVKQKSTFGQNSLPIPRNSVRLISGDSGSSSEKTDNVLLRHHRWKCPHTFLFLDVIFYSDINESRSSG